MAMSEFDKLLREAIESLVEETAAEKAKRLGLTPLPFGNYADKTGKVVAKSRGGHLMPVHGEPPLKDPQDKTPKTAPPAGSSTGTSPKTQPAPKTPQASPKDPLGSAIDKLINTQFRKRIKVAPGVTLNLRRGMFGFSIGKPGFQLTRSKGENYLHMGAPGTGLYRKLPLKDIPSFIASVGKVDGKQSVQFRRRINLGDGQYLNVSRSGVGYKLGQQGFSVTGGPSGTMLHLGIPGSGVFKKFKLK